MCGIIGIQGLDDPISEMLFQGMLQLQHRGQDAAGVFLFDPVLKEMALHKRSGWVFQLFQEKKILPTAKWGLGHIRYSTSGKGGLEDAQPLLTQGKELAIIHNGNLVNYTIVKEQLEAEGVEFQTTCDSEAILHLLFKNISLNPYMPLFERLCFAVKQVYEEIAGAYSIIGMVPGEGLFAFRDPNGIRPLFWGKGAKLSGFASEPLALTNIGAAEIRDIAPGEVLFLDAQGKSSERTIARQKHKHCAFEFNYFARTPSVIEGREIYSIRAALGRELAKKILQLDLPPIDVVVPVPETGNPAGIALAQTLKVPFAEGFIRNQHSGRTFIISSAEKRQATAFQKLAPIRSVFDGKTVLLVDDSIIRGTVSKRTIDLARKAGAKKILFASTFPPVAYPCVYGIDFPSRDQLVASKKTLSEICEEIGADFVIYNELEALKRGVGLPDLCLACVTGDYPTPTEGMKTLQLLRERDLVREPSPV